VMPDFAGAIKGLKTLTSIDDKLDTALANGKIAADRQANDFRAKLAWVAELAGEHRALLADLQQLAVKPIDDFKLAVQSRIADHLRREEARQEAERERIRREEREKIEREQAEAERERLADERARAEAEAAAERERAAAELAPDEPTPDPVHSVTAELRALEEPMHFDTAPAAGPRRTVKLGDINARIAPLSISADGLASLGFQPVGTERAAKLYAEDDLLAIYRGLYAVIQNAAGELKKAA